MFRFTIRDLLWLMVVVGVAISLGTAWWLERSRANRWARQFELNLKLLASEEPMKLARGMTVEIGAHEGQVVLKFNHNDLLGASPRE